jgi:sigma-B regulation protein RsbU (phosphoserine phosphatase)
MFSANRVESSHGRPELLGEFAAVADQIQRALLAIDLPHLPGIEIGARAAPARLVGGDYLDVIVREGRSPLFAIGDVSGKSLPAAMRAVMLKYLVRGLTYAQTDDLTRVLRHTNAAMCEETAEDGFVTFLIATLEHENRQLRIANAGHDPPLIYRAAQGTIEQMRESGLVLGVEPENAYVEQTTALEPEDAVILYTDGFTDARDPGGEQFTLARIKEGLMSQRMLPAQAMADALFERVEAYAAGALYDDASIMVIRITR